GVKTFSSSPVVITPTDGTHATNKSYVDTAVSGAASKWTTSGTNTYLTTTTNNVGIGTTTPGVKLHVVGLSTFNSSGRFATNGSGFYFGTNSVAYRNPGTNIPAMVIRMDEANAGLMETKAGLVLYNANGGQNTGAGIAFASRETTTGGNDVALSGIFGIKESEGVSGGWSQGGLRFWTKNYGSIIEALSIRYDGNVGINTTSPSYKLDVSGTARFTGAVIVGTPSEATHAATKGYVDSTVSSGVTSGAVIAGSTSVGYLKYNGTTALAGALDGGTTVPSGTNRLNYGGYLYATQLYDGGTRVAISSRSITAGDGITGGGNLTANRTIAVNSTVIRTTGNQTLGGVKTFSSSPVVITPTDGTHATNKSYVDTAIASASSKWTTSGTNTYLTTTGNNVGIGTTGPSEKLEVNGMTKSKGFTNSGSVQVVKGLTWSRIVDLNGLSVVGTSFLVSISGTRSNVVWNSTWQVTTNHGSYGYLNLISSTGYTQARLRLVINSSNGDGYLEFYDQGTGAVLGTNQNINVSIYNFIGNAKVLTSFQDGTDTTGYTVASETTSIAGGIISQGGLLVGGNVGIGNVAPGYKLDVSGTGRFTGTVSVGTPTSSNHATTKDYVDSMFSGSGPWTLSGTNIYATNTSHKVGIGTISPLTKLHIYQGTPSSNLTPYSGTQLTLDSNATNNFITFRNSSDNGTYQGLIFSDNNNGGYLLFRNSITGQATSDSMILGSYNKFVFQTGQSGVIDGKTTQMTILQNGNVGIGQATPTYKLDVSGTGRFTGALTGSTATFSSTVSVGTPTSSNHATTKSYVDDLVTGASSKWTVSGTNTYLTTTTNNVGIGTTTPASKLTVNGDIRSLGYSIFFNRPNTTSGWARGINYVATDGSSTYGGFGMYGSDVTAYSMYMAFGSSPYNSSTGIHLLSSGNVGIGTVSPVAKLNISEATGTVYGANQG
ncbi:MAG: hypothetical protein PHT25_11820, partial [Bacteroidales bacterium]|nr:hypothetical protein [Bacteroidales bacterium]